MKPFICSGKRFAFDVTDPHDIVRLQRATDSLEDDGERQDTALSVSPEGIRYPSYLCATDDIKNNENANGILEICRGYYVFFAILFPGQAEQILSDRASVAICRDAFTRWITYLEGCVDTERDANNRIVRLYENRIRLKNAVGAITAGMASGGGGSALTANV